MTETLRAPANRGSILVVDDEEAICAFLTQALRRVGFSVHSAGSGLEATEYLLKNRFDTAILDIRMPDIDGIQLLRTIKNTHPEVSVIMSTGYASVDTASEAVRLGAEDYLLKPVRLRKLEEVVAKAVSNTRSRIRAKGEKLRLEQAEKQLAREKAELEACVEETKARISSLGFQLEHHSEQIASLCEIGTLITSIQDLEQIFVVLMELGLSFVEGEVGSIMLEEGGSLKTRIAWGLDEETVQSFKLKNGTPIVEHVLQTADQLLIPDMSTDARISPEPVNATAQSLLSVPLMSRKEPVGVMSVVNKADGGYFNETDLAMLAAAANFAGIAYENAKLHAESLEKQRFEQELKVARRIQMNLLPLAPPKIESTILAGRCVPAREVGGDLYDFIELADERYGIVLGDVSGKGTPAALIMATARTIVRCEARWHTEPAGALIQANDLLCDHTDPEHGMFVTLVYVIYDAPNKIATLGNAGHCPPLLWRNEDHALERLMPTGPLMGFQKDLPYEQQTLHLSKGDMLVLYTDGFTEAMNPQDEMFGEGRLGDFIIEHHSLPVEEFLDKLYEGISLYTEAAPQGDDMTTVVLKIE